MPALQNIQTRKVGGFGLRALAAAYFEVQKDKVRVYIESKRARHARKLGLIRLSLL